MGICVKEVSYKTGLRKVNNHFTVAEVEFTLDADGTTYYLYGSVTNMFVWDVVLVLAKEGIMDILVKEDVAFSLDELDDYVYEKVREVNNRAAAAVVPLTLPIDTLPLDEYWDRATEILYEILNEDDIAHTALVTEGHAEMDLRDFRYYLKANAKQYRTLTEKYR